MKDILLNLKNNKNLINLVNENTYEAISVEQTADYINRYFSDIGPKLDAFSYFEWNYDGVVPEVNINGIVTNQIIIELKNIINPFQ